MFKHIVVERFALYTPFKITIGFANTLWCLTVSHAGVHLLFVPHSVYFGCSSVDRSSVTASLICVKPTEEQLMSFCPFVQTLAAF